MTIALVSANQRFETPFLEKFTKNVKAVNRLLNGERSRGTASLLGKGEKERNKEQYA